MLRFARNSIAVLIAAVIIIFLGQAIAETAKLAAAPNVPPPVKRSKPVTVTVNFSADEYTGTLADDVKYTFWSFNGTVPGPMVQATRWSFT